MADDTSFQATEDQRHGAGVQPVVWAIVVNWRGAEDTKKAVRALLDSDYHNLRVLVVDNGSGSDEVMRIRQLLHDSVIILSLPDNLGFAAGSNAGIREAVKSGADYVFLVNNDAVVDVDTIQSLVRQMEIDRGIGICGPVILRYWRKDTVESRGGFIIPPLGYSAMMGSGEPYARVEAATRPVQFVSGCAMMVRIASVSLVGMFDEGYFMYAEDKDWCLRMTRCGMRVAVDLGTCVRHMGGRSTSRVAPQMEEEAHYSRARFFLKNYSGWTLWSLVPWLFIWTVVTLSFHLATGRRELAVVSVKGLIRGLNSRRGAETQRKELDYHGR